VRYSDRRSSRLHPQPRSHRQPLDSTSHIHAVVKRGRPSANPSLCSATLEVGPRAKIPFDKQRPLYAGSSTGALPHHIGFMQAHRNSVQAAYWGGLCRLCHRCQYIYNNATFRFLPPPVCNPPLSQIVKDWPRKWLQARPRVALRWNTSTVASSLSFSEEIAQSTGSMGSLHTRRWSNDLPVSLRRRDLCFTHSILPARGGRKHPVRRRSGFLRPFLHILRSPMAYLGAKLHYLPAIASTYPAWFPGGGLSPTMSMECRCRPLLLRVRVLSAFCKPLRPNLRRLFLKLLGKAS